MGMGGGGVVPVGFFTDVLVGRATVVLLLLRDGRKAGIGRSRGFGTAGNGGRGRRVEFGSGYQVFVFWSEGVER